MDLEKQNRIVILPESKESSKSKKVAIRKEPVKRVITETKKWKFTEQELASPCQRFFLQRMYDDNYNTENRKTVHFIKQQIRGKISGYRAQDREKGLFCQDKFVTESDVLSLFESSDLACYYCKEDVLLLYEYVRDPKQWTLERLDNKFGHNRDNIVVACLRCNLRRRCIHSERYVQTQQMRNVVKIDGIESPLLGATTTATPTFTTM
jgi:hypothetical protein